MAANDKVERIECEDEEQRLDRINNLLATLDSSPITSRGVTRTPLDSLLAQPPSEIDSTQTAQLLQRVQAFLPQLQAANQNVETLARENPASVDIETFDGTEESYIQLSLGLGLFEQRTGHSVNGDASSSSDSDTSSEEKSSSDSDGDDSSSEDEDPQPDLISLVMGTRPIHPLPKTRHPQQTVQGHPGIVVLESSNAENDSDHDA